MALNMDSCVWPQCNEKSRSERMAEDRLFSGESKNIEYKVTLY